MAIQFEPKISLGNLLSIASFVVGGFAAYESMDRRITIVEVSVNRQADIDKAQDEFARLNNTYILNSLGDIKRAVEKIGEKLDSKADKR